MTLELATIPRQEVVITGPVSPDLERATNALIKNVAEGSRRIYRHDALQFGRWLSEWGLDIATVGYEELSDYRVELSRRYKNQATARRKLVVARRVLEVAVILKLRTDNPAQQLKGFGSASNETTHRALNKVEARALLAAIDTSTLMGKRDYALLSLLLRTGLRRAEAAALVLGDFTIQQGYNIIVIRHGKGDKRRIVKLPVDVLRAISSYVEATGRKQGRPDRPLFVSFYKGDRIRQPERAMTGQEIQRTLTRYAKAAGIEKLTPHGLRASFVTLTLEGGAKLEQVQYAAGHADPRTTERYQKRKLNLDDNAVDYLKL